MTEFGIFVCSVCSGIHREMNHKGVKGIGMSNFTDKEAESLAKLGNEVFIILYICNITIIIMRLECV